jgi:hypothetical protein
MRVSICCRDPPQCGWSGQHLPECECSSRGRPLCQRAAHKVLMMSHAGVNSKVPDPGFLAQLQHCAVQPEHGASLAQRRL